MPWFPSDVRGVVISVGEIGFILLLFEIGLEVEIPKRVEMLAPAKLAGKKR
jgi:Kef-type K+ transport system membrane component KefB